MLYNSDNLISYYTALTSIFNDNSSINNLYYYYTNNSVLILNILNYITTVNCAIAANTYSFFFLDTIYTNTITSNVGYFLYTNFNGEIVTSYSYYIYVLIQKFFKLNFFLFIIYAIFFTTNIENYLKQIKNISNLTKLFILNASEKEVGPVDDYFFFAILFFLTITLFIFTSIIFILTQSKIFIWGLGGFFLLMLLILTIPVNLFIDFGINFCVGVRGSGTSNVLIKELVLDLLSASIVFIRFVVQNIRFLFIFFGIIELLEWVLSSTNSFIISTSYQDINIFLNYNLINSGYSTSSFNFLIINSILFLILYLYYFLHLLFLLLVQVTIYIGVSIWLFFFLYSSRYTTKLDKFFSHKKNS